MDPASSFSTMADSLTKTGTSSHTVCCIFFCRSGCGAHATQAREEDERHCNQESDGLEDSALHVARYSNDDTLHYHCRPLDRNNPHCCQQAHHIGSIVNDAGEDNVATLRLRLGHSQQIRWRLSKGVAQRDTKTMAVCYCSRPAQHGRTRFCTLAVVPRANADSTQFIFYSAALVRHFVYITVSSVI